jgi:hypothetical protein
LLGLLFLNPLLGAAMGASVGASAGATTGALRDIGINDAFIQATGETLQPGTSALYVLVRQATPDRVIAAVQRYAPTVLHTSLSALDDTAAARRVGSEAGRAPELRRPGSPGGGIGMKLSIDSGRKPDGFQWLTEIFLQSLRGCLSFSRGLGDQTFGGGTRTLQKAVQLELRLKESLHPPRSQRLEMAHEFQQTQFPFVLQPQRRSYLWTQRIIQQNEEHSPIQIT